MTANSLLGACVALILLSGCPTTGGGWNKQGITDQGFMTDRYECQRDIAYMPTSNPRWAQMFAQCMQARGYYWDRGP